MQDQIYKILSSRSGKPLRQIIQDTKRTDFYLDAQAALEYGLIDAVVAGELPEPKPSSWKRRRAAGGDRERRAEEAARERPHETGESEQARRLDRQEGRRKPAAATERPSRPSCLSGPSCPLVLTPATLRADARRFLRRNAGSASTRALGRAGCGPADRAPAHRRTAPILCRASSIGTCRTSGLTGKYGLIAETMSLTRSSPSSFA